MTDDPQKGSLVAIPAFNAAARLGPVIRACRELGFEVFVVDDGSTDGTGECARAAGADGARHERNRGKGAAIRTALEAFRKSERSFLVLMDADGQHDPLRIPDFVACARRTGADLVIGNRMAGARRMPWVRRATNRFMSWLIGRMAGCRVPDTQCGFRLVSRQFAEKFRPTTERYELESEMLIQAGRLGLRIESIPIPTVYAGEASHIHPLIDTLRFLRLVFRYL